jgi:membrane-associated phospholipid phosphatase
MEHSGRRPRPSQPFPLRCLVVVCVLVSYTATDSFAEDLCPVGDDLSAVPAGTLLPLTPDIAPPFAEDPSGIPAPPIGTASPRATPFPEPTDPTLLPEPAPPIDNPYLTSDDFAWSRRNLFKRVISDQGYLVTKWWPQDFKNPWFTVPLLAGVGAAAASGEGKGPDQNLSNQAHSTAADGVARGFATLGDAATGALLIGAFYFIGRTGGHDRLREMGSLSAEALLDAGIWVTALKAITARTRPSGSGTGDFFQYSPPPDQSNGSFPSGHAMGSFAVATVIAKEYPEKRWLPWLAYGTAGLIGVSRVVQGRHYPSDVLVGALLGNSIGRMVAYRAHGEEGVKPRLGNLVPIVNSSGTGVGVAWSYDWQPRAAAVTTRAESAEAP